MLIQRTFVRQCCLNGSLKVTPKIPQTLAEIVTFGKGYIRIGYENGSNIVITYDGHVMQFVNNELLQDKSLF